MNGVLLTDKPKGLTSFDVVAQVRRLTGQRKIGHTGTLDPNATGVLPLLLGNATKAQDIIPNRDKEYIADFKLGLTSDTLDIWGNLKIGQSDVTKSEIEKAIENFRGEISQIPPMYSAVSVNGQRLYSLARQGIEIERKSRNVTVYELTLLSFSEKEQSGRLKVKCSKGTYIRTLIDDIGKSLGAGAVMSALDRTSACGFLKENCLSLEQIKTLSQNGELENRLISTESLFENYKILHVTNAQAKRFFNGGALDIERTELKTAGHSNGQIFRIKGESFVGLGIADNSLIKIYKHF